MATARRVLQIQAKRITHYSKYSPLEIKGQQGTLEAETLDNKNVMSIQRLDRHPGPKLAINTTHVNRFYDVSGIDCFQSNDRKLQG